MLAVLNIFTLFGALQHVVFAENNMKLSFAQILFRHGDRAPVKLYPNDPNPEEFWTEGLTKLTMLGRKQHYSLGKQLHSMYEHFITSNPNEVNALSTEKDRCIRSAQSILASFYAPDSSWKIEDQLLWQPIPVFYTPLEQDKYLYPEGNCLRAEEEKFALLESLKTQKIYAEYEDMFQQLSLYSGANITSYISAMLFYDTLFVEKKHNLTIPTWVEPHWKHLEELTNQVFFWLFNSPLLHRLRAGPFIQQVIGKMQKKLKGDIPEQKIQLYSGHDITVAAVLSALNLYNMKRPPYCATLILELHEDDNNVPFIRLLYMNSTNPEKEFQDVHTLKLKGCSEFCPFDHFLNFTKKLIPGNWELECKLDKSYMEKVILIEINIGLLIGMVVLIIFILATAFVLWSTYSSKSKRYMDTLQLK